MPIFECKNCLPVNVPDSWTDEKKREVANLVRKHGKITAIKLFLPFGMELGDAKNISLHISEEKGLCRCKTELTEYEGNCPKCKRLNLDW